MDLRIADTFTASLARLAGDEQKAVKTTAFDLQLNPASPGMSLHKLDRAKDKHFWSVRVSDDIRIIVHRTDASLLLCYVDHHDKAYQWAERRRLETHPKTGAAQWVEIRERVEEIAVPQYVEAAQPAPAQPLLFAGISEETLLGYGVPREWLADVLGATEDSLLILAEHLPGEAAEALLELATGGTPKAAPVVVPEVSPFDHPDAQRRFRVMGNVEELERALSFPWDKWTVFLHPAQREWVERDYKGPTRVSGSAGTGKTIVALHRAVHLVRRHPDARVLLATFSETLASALRTRLRRLIGSEPRLAEAQRAALWAVFERVRAGLQQQGLLTHAQLFNRLTGALSSRPPPFDFAVIDECQDIGVAQLRFLAALGGDHPNALFFAGDLGQRIFQQPFSWKALGVDIRGRARTLHVNYRTSRQIRRQADRLLGPQVADVDGNTEDRGGTVSVFNGPAPVVRTFDTPEAEIAGVGGWLASRAAQRVAAHEIGVFVRGRDRPGKGGGCRGRPGVRGAGCPCADGARERLRRHHAPGEGTRIPRRGGDGLR